MSLVCAARSASWAESCATRASNGFFCASNCAFSFVTSATFACSSVAIASSSDSRSVSVAGEPPVRTALSVDALPPMYAWTAMALTRVIARSSWSLRGRICSSSLATFALLSASWALTLLCCSIVGSIFCQAASICFSISPGGGAAWACVEGAMATSRPANPATTVPKRVRVGRGRAGLGRDRSGRPVWSSTDSGSFFLHRLPG